MSQCGHSRYSLTCEQIISSQVSIVKCNDCGIRGFLDVLFTPFVYGSKAICPHHGPFFRVNGMAIVEDFCVACGEVGTHDGFKFLPYKKISMPVLRSYDPSLTSEVNLMMDEGSPVALPEPPKVNPENPLGCECGAWVVGQNQYGRGHDSFCKLRRN